MVSETEEFTCNSLRQLHALLRQVDGFMTALRIGDVALLVKCVHDVKIETLPSPSVLELEYTEQREHGFLNLGIVVRHRRVLVMTFNVRAKRATAVGRQGPE